VPKLDREIDRLELTIEGLLKLLGGTPAQRQRFWEIFKGITTPAEHRLAKGTLVAVNQQLAATRANLAQAQAAARQIRG
jgi:hypothetical protein